MVAGSRAQHRSKNVSRSLLLSALVLFVSAEIHPAAQTVGEKNAAPGQDPAQLAKTAESYENFLRGTGPGTASRVEVQQRLGAVYFLLHRYRDSLNVLTSILGEPERAAPPQKNDSPPSLLEVQSWLVAGLDYLELNQLADASRTLRHALSLQPDNANARLALGDALARSGRMLDAADEYQRQARLTPALADAWYKLGLARSQISLEVSRAKVKAADEPITQQLAAEELLAKGDTLNAARTLFRLLHASPNQPEVHAELGTALLAMGYVKAAQDHFHQELVKNRESPLAELGLAQTAAFTGDWTQVGTTMERLSEFEPREMTRLLEFPPAGPVLQAWDKGQMNPPESFLQSPAAAIWKSWLSDSNVVARISTNGGQAPARACAATPSQDMQPGIWLSEECYLDLASRLKSREDLSLQARTKLAEAEFRLGQYEPALRTAKLLHAADPRNGWGVYWLSKAHAAIAEQCFLKVAALNPDSMRVHQMLAEHYSKLSDYPKAKTEFQNAIRLAPDSPDLHLGLGSVLSKTGDWGEAEKELKTTLTLAPKSAFAHYQLGHVYVQQSQWQKAIEQLRDVPPDSSVLLSARLDLAQAESEAGQPSQAVDDLLSVAALDRDGELYFRLAALYRTMGDTTRARAALATFKQRRAASLETDTEEIGALEKEQESGRSDQRQ
jgi:tetratricopeptide (TPR) repeat protein